MRKTLKPVIEVEIIRKDLQALTAIATPIATELAWQGYSVLKYRGKAKYVITKISDIKEEK